MRRGAQRSHKAVYCSSRAYWVNAKAQPRVKYKLKELATQGSQGGASGKELHFSILGS